MGPRAAYAAKKVNIMHKGSLDLFEDFRGLKLHLFEDLRPLK
jgi:hypothetical protein